MKLASNVLKCDKVPVSTGFGFVMKRSASGGAKLEKEIKPTMEGRSFSFNLHDGTSQNARSPRLLFSWTPIIDSLL
jgi:hypothetical protein